MKRIWIGMTDDRPASTEPAVLKQGAFADAGPLELGALNGNVGERSAGHGM